MSSADHIAIVGMAGRFPAARSVRAFWKLLAEGRSATRWLSEDELLAEGVSPADLADPTYVRAANILPDMECFDAGFWGFSPREASILDPQHRHFLEAAWEAFEDAGHMPEAFDGRIGVFAGSGMQAYLPFNLLTNPDLVASVGLFLLRHTGNDKDFMPTRLSYLLNLKGPSVAVQTACSTSLVAVHQAAASLLAGECDLAVAGGSTIELPHRRGYHFAEGEILSPDGLCRAFDAASQGTVFGSGTGIVLLRRLDDALAAGDNIRAVILGSAVNNDGSGKAGYLAPSVDGQAEAAAEALGIADIDPASVQYIEAHGTGTPVGDPIELAALAQAYQGAAPGSIGIGSVKTNIGHLDTAAGVASLIKVVEALNHELVPASLNWSAPNPRFDFASSPFRVVAQSRAWPRGPEPRRAAVNSLGVGGTNAHLLVQEPPLAAPTVPSGAMRLLPFSAQTGESLAALREKWAGHAAEADGFSIDDAAFTLQHGRRAFAERAVAVASGAEDLANVLAGDSRAYLAEGRALEAPEAVFLFPGGGAQYPGACKGLLTIPAFAEAVDACFSALPAQVPDALRDLMFNREPDDAEAAARLESPILALPALFILEYSLGRLLESWGIRPAAMIGHSAGEYAAAALAGVLSPADALRIVAWRAAIMERLPEGGMLALGADAGAARDLAAERFDIAALNGPGLSVLSGPAADIAELEQRLKGSDLEPRRLRIRVAAHGRMLDPHLDGFRADLATIRFGTASVPIISTLTGKPAAGDDLRSADYWTRHLRRTVLFGDAVASALERPGAVFIEVGPGNALGKLVQAQKSRAPVISCVPPAREAGPDLAAALVAAGRWWCFGGTLGWAALPGGAQGRRGSFPTYAFLKQRHWIEPGTGLGGPAAAAPGLTRRNAIGDWFESPVWIEAPLPPADPGRGGRALVFGDGAPLALALAAELRRRGGDVTMIDPGGTVDFSALFAAGLPDRILWTAPLAGRADFVPAFHLVQALQMADPADPPRLTFVAEAGAGGAPPPAAALLTGITRVAPREIPGLLAALVETDGADAAAARAILAEGDSGARDDHVRLQGGKRLVPVLRPAGDGGGGTRIRQGGTYLILGGTGGIGRALAGWLAREFGAKVALIARGSPDNERRISALLRDAGSGTIRFFPADATDPASLDSALARVRDAFGPVQGAFHAAGAIADAPMAAKTADDVAAVLAPKVDGAVNLSALLPAGTLDFFAVFSSSSVVIAPPGQVDYVAANAFLEALAASRPDGLVLAWGAWADTGMAAQTYGQEDSGDGPHPLLGRPDKGPDGSLTFQRWFDPRALWVLQDHVVGGVKILPGTAYLEMARAAAQAAAPDSTLELTGLTLALPMAFPADEPRLVRLTLHPDATGYGLRIESGRGGGTELLDHASGRLERRHRPDLSIPANLRRKESFLPLPQREHPLQGEMIDFGPRWDCLGPIRAAGKVAECLLRLPESFAADLGTWAFHPGLSDMAVTIGLHLLEELRGTPHGIYAPVSFARVRFLAALTPDVLARALLKAHEPRRMARYDVVLKDRQGNPLVIIEDIELRYVAGGSFVLPEEAAQGVTERMLALGIREREAPAVFTRALAGTDRHLLISAVAPAALRRAFAEAPRPRKSRTAREGEAGSAGRSPVEAKLAEFWADLLGTDDIASSDDFFDLGGHSLSAVRLFSRIRKEWGADLPLSALFQAPTLGQLAELVRAEAGLPEAPGEAAPAPVAAETGRWSPLVRIKQGGTETVPLFCVHGAGGNVLNFRSLAGYLRPGQRFFGLQAQGTDGVLPPHDTIEEMADCYLAAIRAEQPEGPYVLAGYSGGGVVAYEMAQCLRADGQEVAALIMFDSLAPHVTRKKMSRLEKLWAIRHWSLKFALDWPRRRRKAKDDKAKSAEIRAMLRRGETLPREYLGRRMQDAYHLAQTRYDARAYDGRIVLFTAGRAGTEFLRAGPKLGWADLVRGGIDLHRYDCDHFNMMADPTIGEIAETLNDILIAAGRSRAG